MDEQRKKKMAKVFWMEINRAVINSSRVRHSLNSMKKKGVLDDLRESEFLLDGKKLIKSILEEPRQLGEQENKLRETVEMLPGEQGQSVRRSGPAIKSKLFPEGFFSLN